MPNLRFHMVIKLWADLHICYSVSLIWLIGLIGWCDLIGWFDWLVGLITKLRRHTKGNSNEERTERGEISTDLMS